MPVPRAFALLAGERNAAVDAALLESLGMAEPANQPAILELLLVRSREQALSTLVGRFNQLDAGLQALVVERVAKLHSGVRLAMGAEPLEVRRSAIELIRCSGDCRLAYLLAEALRGNCVKTREAAAIALREVTATHLEAAGRADRSEPGARRIEMDGQQLAGALRRGLECWRLHFRVEVLTAALWMADRLENVLFELASAARGNIVRAVGECLSNTADARLAGFAIRALAHEKLAPVAARAIELNGHASFVTGLIEQSWLLGEPKLQRKFHRVRQLDWFERGACDLALLPARQVSGLVRLVAASGLPAEGKAALLGEIFEVGSASQRTSAFWQLVNVKGLATDAVLRSLASRSDDALSAIARRELDRRQVRAGGLPARNTVALRGVDTDVAEAFAAYWSRFGTMSQAEQDELRALLDRWRDEIPALLRARLASSDGRERIRGLRIMRDLALTEPMAERVFQLANDPDPSVRSFAVVVLADLDHAVARRILLRALHDPDPRVQSNAIESLDRFSQAERIGQIEPKMHDEHHRVRATAIAALLKMQAAPAGEALFDMLDSRSVEFRISGLWVVERLRLASLLSVIAKMAAADPAMRVRRRAERVLALVQQEAQNWERAAALAN